MFCDLFNYIAQWGRQQGIETLNCIYDFMLSKRVDQSDLIIALGSGVVGDIAGYAAATYLRGMAFIQVPTTLLVQIDSSVGGKVAVNYQGFKIGLALFISHCLYTLISAY